MLKRSDPFPAQAHHGNTLIEYGLIGSLVVLVVIAAMSGIGGDLQQWLAGLKGDMKSQISATQNANASQLKAMAAYEAQKAAPAIPPPNVSSSLGCSGAACASLAVQPYNSAQTAGSNGINIVDQYANKIKMLADTLKTNPNTNRDFIDMLVDLANDGHRVADDERAVLTYTQASDGSFDFSIQDRYTQTKNRALNYLSSHPNELTPEQTQLLHQAAGNINQQMVDFMGSSSPGSLSSLNINPKFTDKGDSGKGATYVDGQASQICVTSGSKVCN